MPTVSPRDRVEPVALEAITLFVRVHRDLVLVFVTRLDAQQAGGQPAFEFEARIHEGLLDVLGLIFVLNFAFYSHDAPARDPRQNIGDVNGAPMQHAPIFYPAFDRASPLDGGEHLRRDSTRCDLPAHVFGARHKVARERGHEDAISRFAQPHEFLCIGHGDGDRLIDNGRNAALEGQLAGCEMRPIGRADKRAVDQTRIEHVAIVGKCLASGKAFVALVQAVLGNVANRRDFHICAVEQIGDVVARTKRAESDDANSHFFHLTPFPGATSHRHRARVLASAG